MKITFLLVGKTEENYLQTGISIFEKRLQHYISFEQIVIPELKNTKNLSPEQIKEKEAELLLKHLQKADKIILLDEHGKKYRSTQFAEFLQTQMNSGIKNLCFVVGGAYGFDEKIRKAADAQLSLSDMTFSHQMIRLLFIEQVYRAMTILRNEPYHNE